MESKLFNVKAGGPRSGNIDRISYSDTEEIMSVRFKNGTIYQYNGVPERIWIEATESPSIGNYLHRSIIGVYKSTKL